MSKSNKPLYAFIRRGNHLVPEMEHDVHALDGIAQGQRVRLNVSEWRNADRLRAYWALLHEAVAATGKAITAERLHQVIKLETGIVDLVRLPTGMTVAIPGSVAFENMSEAEFIAYFEEAQQWLAKTYGFVSEREAA
jgi:hypothetical protein